jgi:hypothetical protein
MKKVRIMMYEGIPVVVTDLKGKLVEDYLGHIILEYNDGVRILCGAKVKLASDVLSSMRWDFANDLYKDGPLDGCYKCVQRFKKIKQQEKKFNKLCK